MLLVSKQNKTLSEYDKPQYYLIQHGAATKLGQKKR